MIDGILLINKERGITSYGVIRKLKKVLQKEQKIGHAGTLDPFAAGLLIILLGRSTKLMEKIFQLEKEYVVKAEFGYSTDTQDVTGKKINISKSMKEVFKEELLFIINSQFIGNISQTPPLFSAKKVKGKKAYEYARENIEVTLNPKNITIKSFKIIEYNWPFVKFNIVCSGGTYVRTLINDLGSESGVYATAIDLERTRIGTFNLDEAIKSENILDGMKLNLVKFENE